MRHGLVAPKRGYAGVDNSKAQGGSCACSRGKARSENWAGADGSDSRFQEHYSPDLLEQNVAAGTTIYTDGLKSFTGLQEAGFDHVPRNQPLPGELRKGAKSAIPLADRAIGNLQQWLIGTHHGVSRDQLQVYLDEFVFRHNRRRLPMAAFQTLLGLGTGRKPTGYKKTRGAADLSKAPAKA
jgi:transposase-like protein